MGSLTHMPEHVHVRSGGGNGSPVSRVACCIDAGPYACALCRCRCVWAQRLRVRGRSGGRCAPGVPRRRPHRSSTHDSAHS
eukprot:3691286-Prymnesium_polylepis.2